MATAQSANTPEEQDDFKQSWRVLLQKLLGWPEAQAAAWARDTIRAVGDNPYLTHDGTAWMVTPLLVPAEVKAMLGPRMNAFCGCLQISICCRDPRGVTDVLSPEYDWEGARRRVRGLLEMARAGIDPDEMLPREVPPTRWQDGRDV